MNPKAFYSESPSILGPTGFIYTPAAISLPRGKYVMGIHQYKFKLGYGPLNNLEVGFVFDAKEFHKFTRDSISLLNLYGKLMLIDGRRAPFNLAIGAGEGLSYINIGKYNLSRYGFGVQVGLSFLCAGDGGFRTQHTMAFSKITHTVMYIFDFDGRYHTGFRLPLSSKLRLDTFLTNITNIESLFDSLYIGICYAE